MQLYELVNKYHVGTTLSCAEAMFKACNEYYGLNLPENTRKMFSIMGIGMQTQLLLRRLYRCRWHYRPCYRTRRAGGQRKLSRLQHGNGTDGLCY